MISPSLLGSVPSGSTITVLPSFIGRTNIPFSVISYADSHIRNQSVNRFYIFKIYISSQIKIFVKNFIKSSVTTSNGSSVQFSSVAQSCPTLCSPMDCSTPRLTVLHQLLELGHTHVHRVGDSIQPFHPLSSSLLLPSILPSNVVFSNESVLHISSSVG